MEIEKLERFVEPFYKNEDIMHDLSHVLRIHRAAKMLAKPYGGKVDLDIVVFGSYFHGMIAQHGAEIARYLKSLDLPEEKIHLVMKVSSESLKEEVPQTLEGKIVHDAHLIEGGKTFMIVKSLITGALRRQTLEETIEFLESSVIGKFHCYLPQSQRIYAGKERFAKSFLAQLKGDIAP